MRHVTQADIARQAGVSQQAVGFALGNCRNSRIKLRSETRQRILQTAVNLGYRPHRYAQVMRRGRSGIIALVQFGGMLQVALERGIYAAKAIHEAGYRLHAEDLLWHRDGLRDAVNCILEARVEGVILCDPIGAAPVSELDRLRRGHITVVSLSGVRFPEIPQVRSDVRQGMFDLTRHLLGLGYERLCLVVGCPEDDTDKFRQWPSLERVAGFRHAADLAGLGPSEAMVSHAENPHDRLVPYQAGKAAMEMILRRGALPEVVLCGNDDWAIGALAACAEAGVRVPHDVAITGFDNSVVGQFSMVPLTTVAQQPEAMGKKAVELLVRLIGGETISAAEQVVKTPCEVVVRKSCGAGLRR
jgi:DNA-binding LacI/PurR family transcriptional regulator